MRARRLCGLTLVVVAAHLAGWRIAVDGGPRVTPARAGIRWIATGMAARAADVASTSPRDVATSAAPPDRESADVARRSVPAPVRPRAAARRVGDAVLRARTPAHVAGAHPADETSHASAHAGDDGARHVAPDAVRPRTPYPTRAPPSATVHYALVQGGTPALAQAGEATLEWRRGASDFSLRLAVAPASGAAREWLTAGAFDAAGIAPERLVERERGRDKRAVNFDRARQELRFSGATRTLPLVPGMQDRWSWVAQLAAIAEAASVAPPRPPSAKDRHGAHGAGVAVRDDERAPRRRIPPGTTWTLQVAGLRGDVDPWVFRVLDDAALPPEAGGRGNDSSTRDGRAPPLLHLLREPERPYDLRIEAWLSPSLHHLPIGLRMSTPPGSWSFALWPVGPRDDPADLPRTPASAS